MERFLTKHADKITGTIACFDRMLFKGYLPLGWGSAMERFLSRNGLRIKDFKPFVLEQADRLKAHAKGMADRTGRPYVHLDRPVRKEDRARAIAAKDGIREGLVCVLAAVEACQSFKLAYGPGRPKAVPARRKCLCLYFYFLDREFGFLHVRIPTWFPFAVQVCLNGHDWLARKMDRYGIAYRQADQAEFATDVMFRDRATLKDLYENLLKHAVHCFSAEDVMTFLGRKLNGNFQGEVQADYKKRWPGARIKHRMKENWIKMYDKHGSVLRIETVINRPYEFKIRRAGIRAGQRVTGWFPMAKGVANLYRSVEVSRAANERYLAALTAVEDPSAAHHQIRTLARLRRKNGRPYRGFNPACDDDTRLFAAVMRGEYAIMGFRNRDIRQQVCKPTRDADESRRQSAQVSRRLKRLHVHGLIAKIPRSRRWRVTAQGQAMMATVLTVHGQTYPQLLATQAA